MSYWRGDEAKGRTGWAGLVLGAVLTISWFGGLYALGFVAWQDTRKLSLNELGDFLGGAVAPVAFLWLVIGYFQQAAALRLQQEEIRLAIHEMRVLGEHAGRQTEALEREEDRIRKLLLPRFTMSARGGVRTKEGKWESRIILLRNQGGRAESFRCQGSHSIQRAKPSVGRDEEVRIEVRPRETEEISFSIEYFDETGQHWILHASIPPNGEPTLSKPQKVTESTA